MTKKRYSKICYCDLTLLDLEEREMVNNLITSARQFCLILTSLTKGGLHSLFPVPVLRYFRFRRIRTGGLALTVQKTAF